MYLIIGLGNPGPEYHHTRHNAGFDLLDLIADKYDIDINKNKFKSMVGEGFINREKVILIKPMTYMNLSGQALVEALNFYKVSQDEFIIVYDDISLEPGEIRIRKKGSAGGHNGIKNIIALTGTDNFNRIKIGVGKARGSLVSHVLGKFSKDEEEVYIMGLKKALSSIEVILTEGIEASMNKFNAKTKAKKEEKEKKMENPNLEEENKPLGKEDDLNEI